MLQTWLHKVVHSLVLFTAYLNCSLLFLGVMGFPVGQSVFNPEERAQSSKVQQFEGFNERQEPENLGHEGKQVQETCCPEEIHENGCPEGKEVSENDCAEGKDVHENGRAK